MGNYTLALGFRGYSFQLLGGARAGAAAFKVANTTGHAVSLSYFGSLGIGFSESGLTLEAWGPTDYGSDVWGAQFVLTAPTPDKFDASLTSSAKAYVALRVDDERYHACAAAAMGPCLDIPNYRLVTIVLAFGLAFP